MIRTIAAWYAVVCGAALMVAPFVVPALADSTAPPHRVRTVFFVLAGVLLAAGGLARLLRLPGRVASVYLGIGAGLAAGTGAISWMLESAAPAWNVGVVGVAIAGLVAASWALWPSGA